MLYRILISVIAFDSVIPAVYGLLWYHLLKKDMRYLTVFAGCDVLFTAALGIIAKSRPGQHNLWLANIYFPFEVCFLLAIFALWEPDNRRKFMFGAIMTLYAAASIAEMFVSGADKFTLFDQPVGWGLVIIAATYTLFMETRRSETELMGRASFWTCAGMIIVGGSQIMLAFMNGIVFEVSPEMLKSAHLIIRPIAGVIEVAAFTAAIMCQVRAKPPVDMIGAT